MSGKTGILHPREPETYAFVVHEDGHTKMDTQRTADGITHANAQRSNGCIDDIHGAYVSHTMVP